MARTTTAAQTTRRDTRVLAYTPTPELWRLLTTELVLLERGLVPPSDWRKNRQHVQFAAAITAELRGRGAQPSLFG